MLIVVIVIVIVIVSNITNNSWFQASVLEVIVVPKILNLEN